MTQPSPDVETPFPTPELAWELDSLYPGGPTSEAYASLVDNIVALMDVLEPRVADLTALADLDDPESEVLEEWARVVVAIQNLSGLVREASSFARCVAAARADEEAAQAMPARISRHVSRLEGMGVDLRARLGGVDEAVFEALVGRPELEDMELHLRELRRDARQSMDPALESLAVDLNRDGLHAWGQLYDRVTGAMQVEIDAGEEGERRELSVGQAKNLLSDEDRGLRRAAFEGLSEAWSREAPTLATTLDSIVGSKQTLYERRGRDALTRPLQNNRIRRETLEAMLEAADGMRADLHRYLELKSRALGVEQLEWFDLRAPVGGQQDDALGWQAAQSFVVEQIDDFSERMGGFFRHALSSRWVEAEDRSGKAQGGFCCPMPASGEVRIFMTYGGTMTNVLTLAHELGHAWHAWLMRDLPMGARNVPMTLAESASTLAEKLVESAALERADGPRELALLDERLQRAVTFLLDIPARYRLELAMHEARRDGPLESAGLREMTREAFRASFGDAVDTVDEWFWASKLHYYITRYPFYNFPYCFGYLFSKALYDRAEREGPAFAETIDALLVDSGRYRAEDLADRYLGADLTDPQFWREAVGSIREDVDRYERLVD